ncbi:hypothetical protein V1520DRAFT_348981 [Lipomyces starkeyi]
MFERCCYCNALHYIPVNADLYMMKKFTPSGAFGFYAGLVVLCYPEVSGLALEEIGHIQTWIWHSVECAHAKSPKVALER